MKKTLFALPLCLLLTFCSHKTVPPPPTGISNVNVGEGDNKVSAEKASMAYSSSPKDWPYKTSNDTTLNGTWTLEGMLQANGSWSMTEKAPAASTTVPNSPTDTAMMVNPAPQADPGQGKKSAAKRMGKRSNDGLYEGAKSRLKMDYKAGSAIDTAAPEPYKYWTRTPAITFSRNAFYGNTGCNSMSGTINYNGTNLQFGQSVSTSKMACMEYDESNFLSLLKKANTYSIISGNTLEIRQGTTVLMTFKRS